MGLRLGGAVTILYSRSNINAWAHMWNCLAFSMDYYMQKTFYKTASLMANSCKAVAVLAGQPQEVSLLAFDYGRHLVCSSNKWNSDSYLSYFVVLDYRWPLVISVLNMTIRVFVSCNHVSCGIELQIYMRHSIIWLLIFQFM